MVPLLGHHGWTACVTWYVSRSTSMAGEAGFSLNYDHIEARSWVLRL